MKTRVNFNGVFKRKSFSCQKSIKCHQFQIIKFYVQFFIICFLSGTLSLPQEHKTQTLFRRRATFSVLFVQSISILRRVGTVCYWQSKHSNGSHHCLTNCSIYTATGGRNLKCLCIVSAWKSLYALS